jgi:selenide,water dikinase
MVHHADVLVDAATRDDAAVVRIAPDRALVVTVDFFTPIVDDPATWGAIAAANALSDVYAMGGRPLVALSLVGWPRDRLPMEVLGEVIRGAGRVLADAGCPVVGGHSIDDPEPKFGLAVIGEADPGRLITNAAARAGEYLVLTKPLGTGILTTALKRDLLVEADLGEAVAVMTTLNAAAARLALEHGVRAGTDVTGFGLIGHLDSMLRSSGGLGAEVAFDALPLLARALELAAAGAVPGGTRQNLEAVDVAWDPGLTEAERVLCADAQTSGGLLLSVPVERVANLVRALREAAVPAVAVIGRVTGGPGLRIVRSGTWSVPQ